MFVDDAGRLMMLRTTYKDYWEIPGGYIEAGETPREAGIREVREELGLHIELGPLLSIDWAPHPDEGNKILFIFDGGTLDPEQLARIQFSDGEIAEYRFVAPDDLAEITIPRLVRRLRATHTARVTGQLAYLEHGLPGGNPQS